ncbi:MAG: vWA domain-containing protein, partial [Bacteroidota bacterium]
MLVLTAGYFQYFYVGPTCFDGVHDDGETATDCGGDCVRICTFEVAQPTVKWSRSFEIREGMYNAVAYVENFNRVASTPELTYTFTLYDETGLIAERSGTTIMPPNSVYPIFEGRIDTGGRVPTKTFLELESSEFWQPSELGSEQFSVNERELKDADRRPRLTAKVINNDLEEAEEVELVATIFDQNRNALTSSRTIVEYFAPRTEEDIVFTWPEPIAKTIRSCEIPTDLIVAIDLSGSMNDDGGDPPQPVSDVLTAASAFIDRINEQDQVGVVTYATESALTFPLSSDKSQAISVVRNLAIAPAEEVGSTNTGDALAEAAAELNSLRHNPDARKVMVLLTDGLATAPSENPEEYALGIAEEVRVGDNEVYVIGLGARVNMDFVRQIATDPTY